MLRHLIRKEILDSLLNYRFVSLAIFSIILMPLSALINYQYFDARRAAFDSQFNRYQEEEGAWSKMRAYHPPALLSSVARGTEAYMPLYFQFNWDGSSTEPGNIEAQDFTTLSTFGAFDFLFLVQVVFSLLAILLTFDAVAGEKENGTLRAVLANRVPRDTVLLGKAIGGFSVLWLAFLLGYLLLWLVLAAFDSRFIEGERFLRMVFILLFSTLFLAGFYNLGLMVSAFCHTTRTAIVSLLVIWVVLQLVIPKAGEMIAAVAVSARSQEATRTEQRKATEELSWEMARKAGGVFTEVTGKTDLEGAFEILSGDTPAAKRFMEEYQQLDKVYQREQRDRVREIGQQYQRERVRQQRVSRGIALLSPATALALLVTDAAGTGDLAYRSYRNSVDTHHQVLDTAVFRLRKASQYRVQIGGSSISSSFSNRDQVDIDSVPAFSVVDPPLTEVLKANGFALGTLTMYLIVPFLVAFVAFMRYDVR